MHNMTKTTFKVTTDPNTGLKYVNKAADEVTKNHREFDKESTGQKCQVRKRNYFRISIPSFDTNSVPETEFDSFINVSFYMYAIYSNNQDKLTIKNVACSTGMCIIPTVLMPTRPGI